MELSDYRKKIDSIDEELVRLFEERMAVASQIAAVKKEKKLPIYDPERERDKLEQVGAMVPDSFKSYTQRL